MVRKTVIALVALALAGVAHAQDEKPITVGPLRFGMSLAEIKAALPNATWEDDLFSTYGKRLMQTRAKSGLTIAETPVEVTAYEYYGKREWLFEVRAPETTAVGCETRAKAVLAALEPGLSQLTADPPLERAGSRTTLPWNVQRLPGGATVVTPGMSVQSGPTTSGEIIQVGTRTTALVRALDDKGRDILRKDFDRRPPAFFELTTRGGGESDETYITFGAALRRTTTQSVCSIDLSIKQPDLRPIEKVTFDAAKLTPALIGFRHVAASGLTLPAEGVTIPLTCAIERATGRVYGCLRSGPYVAENERLVRAAATLYNGVSYDLGPVDKDDPLALTVEIPARLDPRDVRPIDFLDAPRTPTKELRWRRLATGATWERLYPLKLKQDGVQATMVVTCQVQTDYSLVCGGARATDAPPEIAARFAPAVYEGMTWAYAAETKVDGTSSVGAVFDLQLAFKLAD